MTQPVLSQPWEQLRNRFQLTREERTAFYRWSTMNLEGAAVMDEYDQPEWFEYFGKLLKVKAPR